MHFTSDFHSFCTKIRTKELFTYFLPYKINNPNHRKAETSVSENDMFKTKHLFRKLLQFNTEVLK